MTTAQILMPLGPALPVAGAAVIPLFGRWPNGREAVTLISAGATFAAMLWLATIVGTGARPEISLFAIVPGIRFALSADRKSVV